jgi:hypothetical protein
MLHNPRALWLIPEIRKNANKLDIELKTYYQIPYIIGRKAVRSDMAALPPAGEWLGLIV